MISVGRGMSSGEEWEDERTVVGGANTAGSDDEVVALDHPPACLDARRTQREQTGGGWGWTHMSRSLSGMTSTRCLWGRVSACEGGFGLDVHTNLCRARSRSAQSSLSCGRASCR